MPRAPRSDERAPSTPACAARRSPASRRAALGDRGALTFDARAPRARMDMSAAAMAGSPCDRVLRCRRRSRSWVRRCSSSRAELAAFRTAPDPPTSPRRSPTARPRPRRGSSSPTRAIELRFAWLDGAPIAWVAPGARLAFPSLLRGRYGFAWRTFLGDANDAADHDHAPGVSGGRAPTPATPATRAYATCLR